MVSGVVLLMDGKPAVGARIDLWKLPENTIAAEGPTTDTNDRFSFTVLEGLEYSLTATSAGKTELTSEPLYCSLGKGPEFVTPLLNGPEP